MLLDLALGKIEDLLGELDTGAVQEAHNFSCIFSNITYVQVLLEAKCEFETLNLSGNLVIVTGGSSGSGHR